MPIVRARHTHFPIRRRFHKVRGMGQDGTDLIQDPSTGIYYDLSGNPVSQPIDTSGLPVSIGPEQTLPPIVPPPPSGSAPAPGSGLSPQQIIAAFNQAAQGAINIFRQTQSPGLIAGTQAIYNPATGQYYNPVTGQVVNPTRATIATTIATSPNLLLIGGLVIAGVVVVSMLGHKR